MSGPLYVDAHETQNRSQDTRGEKAADHASSSEEEPHQRARQDRYLPILVQGEPKWNRGTGDGPDHGRSRAGKEGLNPFIGANRVEPRSSRDDEGERRSEARARRRGRLRQFRLRRSPRPPPFERPDQG